MGKKSSPQSTASSFDHEDFGSGAVEGHSASSESPIAPVNQTISEPPSSKSLSRVPRQLGSGVSIASSSAPSPDDSQWARPIDHVAFRPRPTTTIAGMLTIFLAVWFSSLTSDNPAAIVVVAAASCFLVGTITIVHGLLRWENAENVYEKERSAAEIWHSKFLRLYSQWERTTSVLSHMTDGIIMLSPELNIVLINEAARHLLALPSDRTYLGRKFSEIIRIPEIVRAVKQTDVDGTSAGINVEIVDGHTVRPIAVRINPMGTIDRPHMLLVLNDETERQRLEAIRREFIANVSHELKTPLAAIKGYAETVELAIEDDPEAAIHFISQIDDQCRRLEALIADMMKLARAQSGPDTLRIRAIDLNEIIHQAMNTFQPVAAAKEIDLSVEQQANGDDTGEQAPFMVTGDEEALLTITQNLVSNAIRHTPENGRVTVHCYPEEKGFVLAVEDNGVGIAPEYQERIFERFYRVQNTRKVHDGGTGIGLSIVKNLVRALNGNIQVISSPGEGARFEVWLPAPSN